MIGFITQGITVGFSAGVMPGPMQSFLLNTALKHGWRRALLLVLTPLLVDIPVIIAVLLALDALAAIIPALVDGVRVVGGIFVLYLAWGAWADVRAGITLTDDLKKGIDPGNEPPASTFANGLLMNALSPGPYLFWTTVNGPLLLSALETSFWWGLAFVVAFYGAFLGVLVVIVLAVEQLRTLDPRVTRGLMVFVALLLTGFGAYLIYAGLT